MPAMALHRVLWERAMPAMALHSVLQERATPAMARRGNRARIPLR